MKLTDLLDQLTTIEKEILILRYRDKMNLDEMAAALSLRHKRKIPRERVRQMWKRAEAELLTILFDTEPA